MKPTSVPEHSSALESALYECRFDDALNKRLPSSASALRLLAPTLYNSCLRLLGGVGEATESSKSEALWIVSHLFNGQESAAVSNLDVNESGYARLRVLWLSKRSPSRVLFSVMPETGALRRPMLYPSLVQRFCKHLGTAAVEFE